MKPYFRSYLAVAVLAIVSSVEGASIIQSWNFNSRTNDGDPSTGTSWSIPGNFSPYGYGQDTTGIFFDSNGSSDPASSDDSALGIIGFSLSPTGSNKTEGVGFAINLPGYQDPTLTLDIHFSFDSVDRLQVQYTDELGRWIDFQTIVSSGPGWINDISLDFTGTPSAVDNPMFIVRFVRLYASESGFQAPGGGAYAGGMIGFDDVIWGATPVPEPSTIALGLLGGCLMFFRASCKNHR